MTNAFSSSVEYCSASSRVRVAFDESFAEAVVIFSNIAARSGARSGSSHNARREFVLRASPEGVPRQIKYAAVRAGICVGSSGACAPLRVQQNRETTRMQARPRRRLGIM